MKSKQNGLSLIGLLIVASLLGSALLIGFRTVPAINEYLAIKRNVKLVAEEGDGGMGIPEMRRSFDRRRQIDDVVTVTGADLEISKQGGKTIVAVEYARKVPIVANVSLLFDFQTSSAGQ